MAFQLGGEQKLLTKCTHTVAGPPLKSFLFEAPATSSPFAAYAEHVVKALKHVKSTFPRLRLHNRVAIVCPDDAFCEAMRPALMEALRCRFPDWQVQLRNASVCSSLLGPMAGEVMEGSVAQQSEAGADDDDMVRATVHANTGKR
jgi:hypothetical protein